MELTNKLLKEKFNISEDILLLAQEAEAECGEIFKNIKMITEYNQYKVLQAFRELRISTMHFAPTYGYGYDDIGRDTLGKLFALVFGAEDAIVRPQIASGTHALALVLYGLLEAGDSLISITGTPYDTLDEIIGISTSNAGSLKSIGVEYSEIALINGYPDYASIKNACIEKQPKMVMIQRSRGYATRRSMTIQDIEKMVVVVKENSPNTIIMVDNCYGEFTDTKEPTEVGADIMVGSLIKNPGGSLAPTGAYIAGKSALVESVAYRLTSPGIGREVGSYAGGYLPFFQGFYIAPTIVESAMKGAAFTASLYEKLGYKVSPSFAEDRGCIIQSIFFNNSVELIKFIQAIQQVSPVDSYALPEPWDMPGYQHPVIMAAGTFIQGASIELSADAPIREPFTAYMQGGIVYEQVKAAVMKAASK